MPSKKIIPELEELQKLILRGSEDYLREALRRMLNLLMELEVETKTGASKHERSGERTSYRNGTRKRALSTGVGEIHLEIPKLRSGSSYYPSFLEPRRMVDKALANVIQEAYINGVSTRKIDKLVEDMGMKIDKSAVSRLCKELEENVEAFRNRPLDGEYPYIWLDATFPKVREAGRVQNMAFVVAIAVDMDGTRHVLGFDIGMSETCVLGGIPQKPCTTGTWRRKACHIRCSRGLEKSDFYRLARYELAALPGALHEKYSLPCQP